MLLDTSGMLCLHNRAEPLHAEAVRLFSGSPRSITHNYVIAEFFTLATSRRLSRPPALAFIGEMEQEILVEIVHVDRTLHAAALQLLHQRIDKNWSLCDAVSFVLMELREESQALTTDHHFEQAGFQRLLK